MGPMSRIGWRVASVFCALACALASQPGFQREVLDLSKIKRKMVENLSKLPDYTCLETVERSARQTQTATFRAVDFLRMEVTQIGDKELFAAPGGRKFEDNVTLLVQNGTISTGEFAGNARKVFGDVSIQSQFAGEEVLKGRRVVKYEYQIPFFSRGWTLVFGDQSVSVAVHGSFWADAETLDLVRLDKHADNIPSIPSFVQASSAVDYGRVRIAAADVLLPQSAEVMLTRPNGEIHMNHTEFSQCRAYRAESSVRFGDSLVSQEFKLPPNLTIPLLLDRAIDSEGGAAGDAIAAHVAADVKLKNQIVVPRGAAVQGRIRQLERSIVAFELSELEFENRRAVFTARLEQMERVADVKILRAPQLPGVGTFSGEGARVHLPSGLRIVWRTMEPKPPDKKPR